MILPEWAAPWLVAGKAEPRLHKECLTKCLQCIKRSRNKAVAIVIPRAVGACEPRQI